MAQEVIDNFYAESTEQVETEAVNEAPTAQYGPFKPLGDRVVVRRLKDSKTQVGSIVIPERYQSISNRAEVVSVSESVYQVKPGDVILIGTYNAESLFKSDDELLIVRVSDIRGVEPLIQ